MVRAFLHSVLTFIGLSPTKKLPKVVGENEKICRAVYSPFNTKKNSNILDPNLFKSPKDKDEVSVNRLNFTTPFFCKTLAKKWQKPAERKNYSGFAILNHKEILDLNFTTMYSPITKPKSERNIFHSDIKAGEVVKTGETISSQLSQRIKKLTEKARYYTDPNIESHEWTGDSLN